MVKLKRLRGTAARKFVMKHGEQEGRLLLTVQAALGGEIVVEVDPRVGQYYAETDYWHEMRYQRDGRVVAALFIDEGLAPVVRRAARLKPW